MQNFELSRLDTQAGIFRLCGSCDKLAAPQKLHISKLEIMACDGWEELNLAGSKTVALIAQIEKTIQAQLVIKYGQSSNVP